MVVFLPQHRVGRFVDIPPPRSMLVCVADQDQASRLDALEDTMQPLASGG
jgi:hypothetical protein